MTGGWPSLARRVEMVIRTALVNGSALMSHAFSSRSSALTRPAGGGHENLKDRELLAGQVHDLAVTADFTAEGVQPDADDFKLRRAAERASAMQGVQPRRQLRELERLGEVVVGPELQARAGTGGTAATAVRAPVN
jgi:hypothetical protein